MATHPLMTDRRALLVPSLLRVVPIVLLRVEFPVRLTVQLLLVQSALRTIRLGPVVMNLPVGVPLTIIVLIRLPPRVRIVARLLLHVIIVLLLKLLE